MKRSVCFSGLCVLLLLASAAGHGALRSFLGRENPDWIEMHDRPLKVMAGAKLNADPNAICARNGTITLSWTGVSSPSQADWIGIFSPANSSDTDYLDYIWAKDVPTYGNGYGQVSFNLLNMRTDYQFRYFGNGWNEYAMSNVITVCPEVPTQGHLSLTGDPIEMRVMWVSNQAPPAVPIVVWGVSPTQLTNKNPGQSHTYQANDMCNAPANQTGARLYRNPGWMHDAVMAPLQPGAIYYYQYGTEAAMSPVYAFRAAPLAQGNQPVRMMVYGDMGDGSLVPDAAGTAVRLKQHAEKGDVDFALHIGDISYARSIGWAWEGFFNIIQDGATLVPYMVGIGNHEYDHIAGGEHDPSNAPGSGFHPAWGNYGDDSNGECGRPTFERFHMPDNGNSLFWYSFDYGSAHIIHMSTEHDYTAGSPQYQWLAKDLASVNRQVTPWVVLAGHRPMYTSEDYPGDYNVSLGMQAAFEDLINQYQVDIAVWGHYHAYERTCAVYKQQCVTNGTINIVVGTAGFELDNVDWMPKVWSLNHTFAFGYGLLDFAPSADQSTTTLTWQFYLTGSDTVFDSVSVTKPMPTHP